MLIKNISASFVMLLAPLFCYAQSHTIPEYVLGEGVSRTQIDIVKNKSLVTDKSNGKFGHYNQEQARVHIVKREKNSGAQLRYSFVQLVDQVYTGPSHTIQFKSGEYSKVNAGITVEEGRIDVNSPDSEDKKLGSKSKEYIKGYFDGGSQWELLVEIASSQPFALGQPVSINKNILNKMGFSEATAKLKSINTMWQMQIAEFEFTGMVKGSKCTGHAWYTYAEGRPIQHSWSCEGNRSDSNRQILVNSLDIRGWQYSDLKISKISPTPLPQLHPNGEISEIAYNESLERLLILSRSSESGENWLTYWDTKRRQAILSKKVHGSKLSLSKNDKLAAVASTQRMVGGELQFGDKFKTFGKITPKKFEDDNKLLSMGLYGYYPVILSSKGEIAIWNLGYNKNIGSYQAKNKNQTLLVSSDDGRVITSSKHGESYLYKMGLDISECNKEADDGWCEGVTVDEFQFLRGFIIPSEEVGSIILHPSKPILAMTVGQYNTAVYYYESGKYVVLNGTSIHFDESRDQIVTDQALYDLDGQKVKEWEAGLELPYDTNRRITSSSKSQIFFQSSGYLEGLSGIRRVQMRDYNSGKVLANIESQTKPSITISHKRQGLS